MERYSDKNYVAKVNKGEAKQTEWIEMVQAVISETDRKGPVKEILQKLATFENVPRKKAKFMNFMRNCAGSRMKTETLEEVWSLLEIKQKELKKSNDDKKDKENVNKNENGHEQDITNGNNEQPKIKRKLEDEDTENCSKMQKLESEKPNTEDSNGHEDEISRNGHAAEDTEQHSKFEWKKEIVNCLNSNDNEISMKTLRKKMIENYLLSVNFDKQFMKKLKKVKGLVIDDNLVKLNK